MLTLSRLSSKYLLVGEYVVRKYPNRVVWVVQVAGLPHGPECLDRNVINAN